MEIFQCAPRSYTLGINAGPPRMLTFNLAVILTNIQIQYLPHSLHVGDSVDTTTFADCLVHANPPKCFTILRVVRPERSIRNAQHRNPQGVCCITLCESNFTTELHRHSLFMIDAQSQVQPITVMSSVVC